MQARWGRLLGAGPTGLCGISSRLGPSRVIRCVHRDLDSRAESSPDNVVPRFRFCNTTGITHL